MLENSINSAILFAFLPIMAVVGLSLNMFIRARGGRALSMHFKGFGVDIKIDSTLNKPTREETTDV